MNRLNYFIPYQSKGAWHEDQLTRAFLVIVRMVPLALAVLLDLIRDEQMVRGSESKIPSSTELLSNDVEIQTQKNSIPQTTGHLISVMMTDEEWKPEQDVVASNRGARYDGIVSFDPEWIIVIENKPSVHNIWEEQVHPNLPEGHDIKIDKMAIVILWRKVIERLTALVSANILHGTERIIVDDFLQFIDEEFPYLNPYDTFGKCKNSASLLKRRCRNILEAIAPRSVEWQPIWGTYYILLNQPSPAKMCALYPKIREGDEINHIESAIYPGDSMAQARVLFTYLHHHDPDALFALRDQGWKIRPNFHFGFIRRGFGHGVNTRLSLEEYIHYWTHHPIEQLVLKDRTFKTALHNFVDTGMMDEGNVSKVVASLPPSARNVNIIPGIEMLFDWPLNKAVEIDRHGGMVEEFRRTMNEALAACGCELFGLT